MGENAKGRRIERPDYLESGMMQSDHSVIGESSQHACQLLQAYGLSVQWQTLLPARSNWAGRRILHTDGLAVEDNFRVRHGDDARE